MKKKLVYEYKTDESGKISELKISYNLKSVKGIGRWSQLTKLDLSGNEISQIPNSGISKLKNLKSFDLSGNNLKTFPQGILALQNLQELKLNKNQLTALPEEIKTLKNLEVLEIKSNKLSKSDFDISNFPQLRKLAIDENDVAPQKLFDTQKITALIQMLAFKHQQLQKQISDLNPYIQKMLNLKQNMILAIKNKQVVQTEEHKKLIDEAEANYATFSKIMHNSELIASEIGKYKLFIKNGDIDNIRQIQQTGISRSSALIEEMIKQLAPLKIKLIKLSNKVLDAVPANANNKLKNTKYGTIDKVIK